MCGRFTLTRSAVEVAEAFDLMEPPFHEPRFNIAPTQPVPVIVATEAAPQRQFRLLYWGLIPSWADDPAIGSRMINARAETLAEKPSFRTALKRRRCLVLADGFYEWQRVATSKQPYYFQVGDRQPFAFAGLWEHWQSKEGDTIDSCTIITTEPNSLLSQFHNRMPVILHPQEYDRWLDPTLQKADLLQPLLRPYPAEHMGAYPVSMAVNNPRYDTPDCVEAIALGAAVRDPSQGVF